MPNPPTQSERACKQNTPLRADTHTGSPGGAALCCAVLEDKRWALATHVAGIVQAAGPRRGGLPLWKVGSEGALVADAQRPAQRKVTPRRGPSPV